MEWSICGVNKKYDGPAYNGAGSGICRDAGGITGIWVDEEGGTGEEEGVGAFDGAEVEGASDLLPLAFLGPLKVTIGSSRFQ